MQLEQEWLSQLQGCEGGRGTGLPEVDFVQLVVPATGLFSLPEADPRQLAMLGINPPTASLLLDEASDLKPGGWVVQNAANSGVSNAAKLYRLADV